LFSFQAIAELAAKNADAPLAFVSPCFHLVHDLKTILKPRNTLNAFLGNSQFSMRSVVWKKRNRGILSSVIPYVKNSTNF